MATFVTFTDKLTAEEVNKVKTPQCRQLLSYFLKKYESGSTVDQGQLLLDLNEQQNTGLALTNGSSGPISRIYEFYRKKGMKDTGFITISKSEPRTTSAAALQTRVDDLEQQLELLNEQFERAAKLLDKHDLWKDNEATILDPNR
jgi:hypothetical protein